MRSHHITALIAVSLSLFAAESVSDMNGPNIASSVAANGQKRCANMFKITALPPALANATMVAIARGDSSMQAPGFSFKVNRGATIYLLVHDRGTAAIPSGWTRTSMKVEWTTDDGGMQLTDTVYKREFPAGTVTIPGHDGRDEGGAFGVPNAAIVTPSDGAPGDASSAKPLSIGDLSSSLEAKVVKFAAGGTRLSGNIEIAVIPSQLNGASIVGIIRGDRQSAAPAWKFSVSRPVIVYMLVHDRGTPSIPASWVKTSMKAEWKAGDAQFTDTIYSREFAAGTIDVPGHSGVDESGNYGIPNSCVVIAK
ncbi:MAG: hypothetical protein AABZ39_11675 [Spirochaetota bacterium]